MSLTLAATASAVNSGGVPVSFAAQGGAEPYVFSVLPDGAGGAIDSDTGDYLSPLVLNLDPKKAYDTIQVEDDDGATATLQVLVGSPLLLFCDILQKELNLDNEHCYLYNQKFFEPKDSSLYIAVSVLSAKPFANTFKTVSGVGLDAVQSVNMMTTLSINAISRSNEALFRKEEIIMALNSYYAQSQQTLNSFYVGKLPPGAQFVNLSNVDGMAIPYRFNITINIQYFAQKVKPVPYFDEFETPEITTEP